ncbi:MAG TPA: PIN domain-containing protein [Vicinamibacterales bacterium]|nr:PIN domain-containing protein [Vicinamibacterales bacterium]
MIHLDTSVLIDGLTGPRRSAVALRRSIERGERILLSTIVLYEWLRGRRHRAELAAQEALFPRATAVPFGADEARIAADLSRGVTRGRGREIDLAIAATAMAQNAALWTLNIQDFRDFDGLALYDPSRDRR